jgi:hypothetical protein
MVQPVCVLEVRVVWRGSSMVLSFKQGAITSRAAHCRQQEAAGGREAGLSLRAHTTAWRQPNCRLTHCWCGGHSLAASGVASAVVVRMPAACAACGAIASRRPRMSTLVAPVEVGVWVGACARETAGCRLVRGALVLGGWHMANLAMHTQQPTAWSKTALLLRQLSRAMRAEPIIHHFSAPAAAECSPGGPDMSAVVMAVVECLLHASAASIECSCRVCIRRSSNTSRERAGGAFGVATGESACYRHLMVAAPEFGTRGKPAPCAHQRSPQTQQHSWSRPKGSPA